MRLYTPAAGGATAGRQEGPTAAAGGNKRRTTPTVTVTSTPSGSFGTESSISGVTMFGTINNNYKVTTVLVLTVTHLAEGRRKKVKTKL